MNGVGLSFTFQGVAPYAYPKGTATWFHWQAPPSFTLQFAATYTPPASTSILFTFQDGIHPTSFIATQWGTTVVKLGERLINVPGWNSGAFGTASIRLHHRYVSPAGTKFSAYGSPTVYNKQQKAYATGTKFGSYGLPTIYNRNRYFYFTGFQSGSFGTQIVQNRDVHPAGWKEVSRFGRPTAYNKTVKIYPPGTIRTIFGTGLHVDNHKFVIPGLVQTIFGTTAIHNYKQILTPIPAVMSRFGTQWVSNKRRYVYAYHPQSWHLTPSGDTYIYGPFPDEYFGLPTQYHNRITPKGAVQSKFGTLKIQAVVQYVYAHSTLDKFMGNKNIVMNQNRPVQMTGWVDGHFGTLSMSPMQWHPTGFIATKWTDYYPRVGGTKVTNVGLGNTIRFGTAFASYTPRYIRPNGIAMVTKFGAPPYGVMHTFKQYPALIGFDAAKWGREDWDFRGGMYVIGNERRLVGMGVMSSFGRPTAADAAYWNWKNARLSRIRISE